MQPKISIILTSYNKPSLINQVIESVLMQTYKEWELFIMDDNSCPETINVIKNYLEDSRITYKNSFIQDGERYKTTRYATLINEALPLTCGDYICYLTDDTIYLPNRLAEMLSFLEKHPEIDVVYSSQYVKHVDYNLQPTNEFVREASKILYTAANVVDHCSIMHTKRILLKVYEKYCGYWDTNPLYWFVGDAMFWKRLNTFQPFYPISKVLDITFKTPFSFQNLYANLPSKALNGILFSNSNGEVFLIDNFKRRLISKDMLSYFKYNQNEIVLIPDPFIYKYTDGPPITLTESIPNLRVVQNEKKELFYIENNQKRPFINTIAFRKFKFTVQEIVKVSQNSLDQFSDGPPIYPNLSNQTILPEGKVFIYHHNYFIMTNHMLHPIDKDILQKLYLSKNCIPISKSNLSHFKIGPPITSYPSHLAEKYREE
ncbi:glycosyltransferase family 2 protein [Bacillus cereus]|uniref:glycosyltransferase family 2 protein n=1 Tax=Bacillus cereus TaxID=1396 RepID=UPI0024068CEA|nr:glycosyltransferase family A protein [Bacillus cereus]MDF9528495.1 glycosyltransferase family A protein [Bacillus cereus]MDG1576345.1 glycosyltransferase family A protein [Bacillus cereus]